MQAAHEATRPMRGLFPAAARRNERLAVAFSKDVMNRHVQWLREFFDIIPNFPKWDNLDRKVIEDAGAVLKAQGVEVHGDHVHFEKAFPEGVNPQRVNAEFSNNFGLSIGIRFDEITEDYLKDVVGREWQDLRGKEYIYGKNMNEAVQTYVNDAREQVKRTWDRQPQWWKDQNPFNDIWNAAFWEDSQFINTIYQDGYDRVTNKVTIDFGLRAKDIINNGLKEAKPWTEIARDVNKDVGIPRIQQGKPDPETGRVRTVAAAYHWKRLVRSEMANGIHKASMATYRETEPFIEAVKYNAALGRCNICEGHATRNNGFYAFDNAPDVTGDTHPNCRCMVYPIYDLPAGISV